MNQDIIENYKQLETSQVSDAMDTLGIECALLHIKPLDRNYKVCGPAFTVKYGDVKKNSTVGDFLDDVESSSVIVIDNNGRTDCTVWGDIMSTYAMMNKIEATIINGVCRDIHTTRKIGFPMYTKGSTMRTGKDRVSIESINKPITISNVLINPGDLIFGDDNGALVIPQNIIQDVYQLALEIKEKEDLIIGSIKSGSGLKEARETFGYHTLQRKK